jgi:hypothetical protein
MPEFSEGKFKSGFELIKKMSVLNKSYVIFGNQVQSILNKSY